MNESKDGAEPAATLPEAKWRLGYLPLVLCVVSVVLDQWTKLTVAEKIGMNDRIPVISGFFDLTHIHNSGAAWGMLQGYPHFLSVVSGVMLCLMLIFRRSVIVDCMSHRWAYGLLLGGIIGNFIDRVKYSYVIDFLYFFDGKFPAFNIADSCICVGVGIYIASSFWIKQHPLNDSRKSEKESVVDAPPEVVDATVAEPDA